jgi:hypothetical protein
MDFDIESAYTQWRRGQEAVARMQKVFALGCAKSGTTWLADLLNAHEEIVVRGEGGFGWQLVPILSQAFRAFNEHQKHMDPIARLRDVDLLLAARAVVDGQLYRYVSESGRDPARIRVVGDKTPQHSVCMPLLDQLYPQAKFIHIIRDPRDTATSAWFHFGKSDPRGFEGYIEHYITQVWPANVNGARTAGASMPGRYIEVRYEDLLADATTNVRRLLDFLAVDASDTTVARCVDAASFQKKSGGRKPGQTVSKSFFRSGTRGDWRNHLPIELASRCCAKVAPLMQACGYDPKCEAIPSNPT